MIRGNWVVQSECLYPEKTWSTLNGVPAEFMCRARDYIVSRINQLIHRVINGNLFQLYQFTKKLSLSRQKMADVTQLPAEELKEIMESVAVLNDVSKEWEMAVEHDQQFEKNNSDLVQRQDLVWRSKEEQFSKMEAERPSTSTFSKRIRKRSVRESKPTDSASGASSSKIPSTAAAIQ